MIWSAVCVAISAHGYSCPLDIDDSVVFDYSCQLSWPGIPSGKVQQCWTRLFTVYHRLNRHEILAVTYMVHLESVFKDHHLRFLNGQPILSEQELKIIRHFGNRVDCCCGCGCQWTFANGKTGLQYVDGQTSECKVLEWMFAPALWGWALRNGSKWHEANKDAWLERRRRKSKR